MQISPGKVKVLSEGQRVHRKAEELLTEFVQPYPEEVQGELRKFFGEV